MSELSSGDPSHSVNQSLDFFAGRVAGAASADQPVASQAQSLDDRGRVWIAETGVQPNRLVAFDPRSKKFVENIPVPADGPNTIRHMQWDQKTRQIWFGADANQIGRIKVAPQPVVP